MIYKNKRGWIRIVEAFVAILLIAGVLLIVIDKGYIGNKDISKKVYDTQLSILKEIQLDNELRTQILGIDLSDGGVEVVCTAQILDKCIPSTVSEKIASRTPDYLECQAKVCKLNEICALSEYLDKDVYSKPVAITADLDIYNPRQLKLFCWTK